MTLEEIMQMRNDPFTNQGLGSPPLTQEAYEKQMRETNKEIFDRIINPLGKLSGGLRIVRGAKKAKGGTRKLLDKPKSGKPKVPRSERKMEHGFKNVGAKEFHMMLDKVDSLDVEKKSLESLEDILDVGGKLFRGVGKYKDAIYGISPGGTENELIAVHVPKELRGSGAGTEIVKDARRRNLKISGNKPLVGYAIKQTPEEGSYLDRFYTTGGRDLRRTHTYKYDPALADPERIKRGYAASDVGRYQSGIEPKAKMPRDWQNVGEPRSKLVQFGDGKIPGGLEGTFSFRDLVYMKANPFSLSNLTPLEEDQLYRKHALTMTRDLDDPLERLNTLVFGQLTGNSDLENSQLMLSRLRSRTIEDVQRLASYIPEGKTWKTLSRPERTEISNRLIGDYHMQARPEGGLGIAGSFDFSGVADLARQHLANPDFHKQIMGEPDLQYIERIMNQVPGLGQKTMSLSQLMLKPATSEYGGLDLHMKQILDLDPKGIGTTRQVNPSGAHPTHQTRENVPPHVKALTTDQLKGKGVHMMSPEYRRGSSILDFISGTKPFGAGMTQWQRWDKRRGHFDPHEQLYPGIHKFTERMPDWKIQEVRDTLAKAGHWSKTDPDSPHQFKPQNIKPARDAMYYGLLPMPINKILNAFKPREPWEQALKGGDLGMLRYGSGS